MRIILTFVLTINILFVPATFAVEGPLAQHLLSRSGFSSDPTLLSQIKNLSYEKAVDYLLNNTHTKAKTPAPSFVNDFFTKKYKSLSRSEKKQLNKTRRKKSALLKAWWIEEMITTNSPLTESMTLFWHNHFTSSFKKVKSIPLMYRQNVLLRQHALGNFSDLLQAIAKDPAMLIYLDGTKNHKGSANENFAREVMELFTLGEGNYSEDDVKQAAIAFTGWSVNRKKHTFQFRSKQHDKQTIHVLGKSINAQKTHAGEEVLKTLLDQPATAVYLSTKLYKHFISYDAIDQNTIKHLANTLRINNYEIKPWLKALFMSKAFKQQQQKGSLIKSPIDLIVGTFRSLSLPVDNALLLAKASKKMGQDLFNPPNVKGWPGGNHWINTNTFLIRKNILNKFLREQQMIGMGKMMREPPQLLLTKKNTDNNLRSQILDPAYQVK